jgi:hypothetical protein
MTPEEKKKLEEDVNRPHGYCYGCGKGYRFTSNMEGCERLEPGLGFTSPPTERVCDHCWSQVHEEARDGEDLQEYLVGWLEELQTLIGGWPEDGSLPRFQDALRHVIQGQIGNLQKARTQREEINIDTREVIDNEKALLL